MRQTALPKQSRCETATLDLAHSDLWGPSPIRSRGGSYYFISFTDDSSHYSWVRYLRKKSDAFAAFKEWLLEVERQTGQKLWIFRSNNGGEYITTDWERYLKDNGIVHQKSTPRAPKQNGISEQLNLTLMDRVRTTLIESQLPLFLWAEAVECAVYTKNRSPTAAIKDKTPFEVFWSRKPDISNLRVFGSQCYVHNDAPSRQKFDNHAIPAIFIGYSLALKAWKYFIPVKQKAGTSRNITFDEHPQSSVLHHNIEGELAATKTSTHRDLLVLDSDLKSNIDDDDTVPLNVLIGTTPTIETTPAPSSSTLPPSPYLSPTSTSPPPVNPSPVAPADPPSKPKQRTRGPAIVYEKSRSSQRIEDRNKPKPSLAKATEDSNGPKPDGHSTEDDDEARVCDELEPKDNELAQATAYIATGQDPDSYEEAISSVDRDECQTMMQSEMESITSIRTFELVLHPHDWKLIGCKWVY